MPPQLRSAFNWSLFVQVASVLISMGIGAVLVVQEQKTQIALDHQDALVLHQELAALKTTVEQVRANQLNVGTYDVKLLDLQTSLNDLKDDLKIERLRWDKDHAQLLARRLVQP